MGSGTLEAIHAFNYRFLRNRDDAADVAQEAFLRVWSRAGTYYRPGRVKFTTWLHRIARNLCIDVHRRRTSTEQLDVGIAAFAVPSVPIGLPARIEAGAPGRDQWLEWLAAFIMRPWRSVGAACAPLMLGFALGLGAGEDMADLEDSVLVAFSEPLAGEREGRVPRKPVPLALEASDE